VSRRPAATTASAGTCYYRWLKRYEDEGLEGLRDRSSAPHQSPTATSAEVVEKILWLRQQYHFGPGKISMYLERYHQLTISPSGVWRILHRAGCPPHSVTSAERPAGSATRSSAQATSCRSTSSSSSPWAKRAGGSGATSTPPSTTAPACEYFAPTHTMTSTQRSRSSTTCCPSCYDTTTVAQLAAAVEEDGPAERAEADFKTRIAAAEATMSRLRRALLRSERPKRAWRRSIPGAADAEGDSSDG
jgi:transposase